MSTAFAYADDSPMIAGSTKGGRKALAQGLSGVDGNSGSQSRSNRGMG